MVEGQDSEGHQVCPLPGTPGLGLVTCVPCLCPSSAGTQLRGFFKAVCLCRVQAVPRFLPPPTTHLPSPGQSSCQSRAGLACTQGCGLGLCLPPRPPGSPSTRSAACLQRLRCFCSFSRDLCDRKWSCLVRGLCYVPFVLGVLV